MKGVVFDIQRASVDDGPGIRTVVFLKGCGMRCLWCHNPESQSPGPEVLFYPRKCTGCGRGAAACANGAHAVVEGKRAFLRERCARCGRCAEACPSGALTLAGREMETREVMEEVQKDALYYRNSGGGVTFSGGEPLRQIGFLQELLRECKALGFHAAVETAGDVGWDRFERILPCTDLFLYDVKAVDDALHRRATGAGNGRILANLRRLSREGREIVVRMPVVPGFNDTEQEIGAMARLARGLPSVRSVELLAYHGLGEGKYDALGREYALRGLEPLTEERMKELKDRLYSLLDGIQN